MTDSIKSRTGLILVLVLGWSWSSLEAQFRSYSLSCLAPILQNIDHDAPKTLQEAFLSGPFQLAEALQGIGVEGVSFPISTASEEAQKMFDQGIALLHLLWYAEAERAFRTVVELDPDCPMGYWGLSQANELRPGRARLFARSANDHCDGNRPELERRWIDLLHRFYEEREGESEKPGLVRIRELESLVIDFPDHREANAFLIRRLVLDEYRLGVPVTSHLAVESLVDEFEKKAPGHPSRHYRLFLWLAERPERMLDRVAGTPSLTPLAPDSWRYAAESFSAAGRPAAAAIYNEMALRTEFKLLSERGLMPDRSKNLKANQSALIRALIDAGRIEEALQWAVRGMALPRDDLEQGKGMEHLYVDALVASRQWERLLRDLETQSPLPAADRLDCRADRLFWKGMVLLALGRTEAADQVNGTLAELKRHSLATGAPEVIRDAIDAAEAGLEMVEGLFAGELEEITLDRSVEALFPPLTRVALYEEAGLDDQAHSLASAHSEERPGCWLPAAISSYLAYRLGRQREGLFRLDRVFRSNANLADPGLWVFGELDPLAKALRLPEGWSLPAPRTDRTHLPGDLDEVGPGAWVPFAAPAVELSDRSGETRSLDQFEGRPLLLNFFLGARCPFCLEQFKLFQPHWPAFEEAGIGVAAVTIDSVESMNRVMESNPDLEQLLERRFPYPVLADPELSLFRQLDIFDEFENGPMHGIVLIGADGRVLWRRVSHGTFDQPRLLLSELKRLLRLQEPPRKEGSVLQQSR